MVTDKLERAPKCDLLTCPTKRERECMAYLVNGFSAKKIAHEMGLSVRTIEQYIASIKIKFGAINIPHAVAIYVKALCKEKGIKVDIPAPEVNQDA